MFLHIPETDTVVLAKPPVVVKKPRGPMRPVELTLMGKAVKDGTLTITRKRGEADGQGLTSVVYDLVDREYLLEVGQDTRENVRSRTYQPTRKGKDKYSEEVRTFGVQL